MIYRLLYKLLHDSAAVRDRVGARIYAEHAPAEVQGACIIIRNLSGRAEAGLDGESDCAMPMIQVDCYDDSMTKAESLYQLVRNRMSWFRGSLSVLNESGGETEVDVHEASLIRPGAFIEAPRDASDRWSYRYSADFEVFYEQAVPDFS